MFKIIRYAVLQVEWIENLIHHLVLEPQYNVKSYNNTIIKETFLNLCLANN